MDSLPIRQILERVAAGNIRIPAFQRAFIWDEEHIAYFMDSLHKGYPIGSLLFWRTKQPLKHDRKLGPYRLPERDPDYPIDYVLDGQQRVTSIFAVFQTQLPRENVDDDWLDVYFDFRSSDNVQDAQFQALSAAEADKERYFPLAVLFDSRAYREALEGLDNDAVARIDGLYSNFKEVMIPVQVLATEDRHRVAIVFERINRMGVELDTFELLTAWTWSEEFDLVARFQDLRNSLADYGFSEVGEDADLMLRCCAAILQGKPTADALIDMNGADVRNGFDKVEQGIRGAVDFLRSQLHVETLRNLPYPALLVPLSCYFADDPGRQVRLDEKRADILRRWFWRACFSRRYSGQTLRAAGADIEEMRRLRKGEPSKLGDFAVNVDASFFSDQEFRMGTANTKSFILLLAQMAPKSLVSGSDVALGSVLQAYNRAEFHHIFPVSFLRRKGVTKERINAMANFCFLSSVDNKTLGGTAPSTYKRHMVQEGEALDGVLRSNVCPPTIFDDEYEAFVSQRSEALAKAVEHLTTGIRPSDAVHPA